ncbi:hypothetical protein GCM10020260_03770 [Nesterenkonia halobia]|uniref:HTH-like domain-containing protein n=1 Tax=Nesterenkonia halobia TaxID=37922 RepID=A0ABP6R9B7_9MICC
MIAFIDAHRDHFGVEAICRVLGATDCGLLSSRGYRAATLRPTSARKVRDKLLISEIRKIHADNYGVYGYRKMHQAMRQSGWHIGRDQTARLMKAAGLEGGFVVAARRSRQPLGQRLMIVLTSSNGTSPRGVRTSYGSRTFPRKREVPHLRSHPARVLLHRVHHRRLHPANRRLGRRCQPSHRGAADAGTRARSAEHPG